MIGWTGLAPWEFEFPFPAGDGGGVLFGGGRARRAGGPLHPTPYTLHPGSGSKLSDTRVYELQIRQQTLSQPYPRNLSIVKPAPYTELVNPIP